ncbi:unnamed protein product, partial [Tilletia laevis]
MDWRQLRRIIVVAERHAPLRSLAWFFPTAMRPMFQAGIIREVRTRSHSTLHLHL